jgi:hypothetical protein
MRGPAAAGSSLTWLFLTFLSVSTAAYLCFCSLFLFSFLEDTIHFGLQNIALYSCHDRTDQR